MALPQGIHQGCPIKFFVFCMISKMILHRRRHLNLGIWYSLVQRSYVLHCTDFDQYWNFLLWLFGKSVTINTLCHDSCENLCHNFVHREAIWATFPRQDQAIQFTESHGGQDLAVFQYQDHLNGQRRFLATSYDEFWHRYGQSKLLFFSSKVIFEEC